MGDAFFEQRDEDLFGADPEADPGMALGEDILSIRRLAVERRANEDQKKRAAQLLSERLGGLPPGPSDDPGKPTFAANLAEQRREQIDLNAGTALSRLRLEDPKLTAHMNIRRGLAAAEAEKGASPPPLDTLRAGNKEASRGLSTVTLSLKGVNMALRCVVEEVLLEADNAVKLACGGDPHGYPPEGAGPRDRFKHMGRRLAAAGASLGNLLGDLEQAEADLTVARRFHETTAAGLLLWAESDPRGKEAE